MKRPSLAASIKAAAAPAEPEAAAPTPARMPAPSNDRQDAPEGKRAPSRKGRKAVYAFMDPAEHLQLKRLSLDTGRTIDALVAEAVHLLFAKHNVQTRKHDDAQTFKHENTST